MLGGLAGEVAGAPARGPGREICLRDAARLGAGLAHDEFVEGVVRPGVLQHRLDGGRAGGLELGQVGVAGGAEVGGSCIANIATVSPRLIAPLPAMKGRTAFVLLSGPMVVRTCMGEWALEKSRD